MGIIAVVGNAGVGKTTLAKRLVQQEGFSAGLEQIDERPFQKAFAGDLARYALANQVDFLLFRAEQEALLRERPGWAVVDGGLEQDFHLFTRFFFEKGYLTAGEFDLCWRLYKMIRRQLPPPEIVVYLAAPLNVIAARYTARDRALEIIQPADLPRLQQITDRWITDQPSHRMIQVDASDDRYTSDRNIAHLVATIREKGAA